MSKENQLNLLPETREEKLLRRIRELEMKLDKMRKSQYGKISELVKICNDLKHEHEAMKMAICRGDIRWM